ncbi:MAG: ATP-binding protein [Bacillota bacterium]|nr:ATP-binding protein [Bacillota bacterium]MDW7677724.1 ATP-binding protein [Bacillota bacterium]
MERLIAFAYHLLQAAGSETSRMGFVHTIFRMIEKETGADETDLFFYHDQKLYQLIRGVDADTALRLCDNNPLAQVGNIWSERGQSFEWMPAFFQAYCDPKGLTEWSMSRQGSCHSFQRRRKPSVPESAITSVIMVSFTYQHDKMGLVVLKQRDHNPFDPEQIPLYQGMSQALSEAFEHQHSHHACQERVKELSCLFEISHLAGLPDISKEEVLHRIAMMLPGAMQFPEIATARICLDDVCFTSEGFGESKIRLTVVIASKKKVWGTLDVFYLSGQIDFYDDIFLKEEEKLLQTVAAQIALLLERKEAEELSKRLQNQLLHADRLATIGQLSAGVAHEINEPLGSILGFSQLIRESHQDEITRRDVDKIIKATLHAREIIRKLMLFSRQMPPRKSCINVNKIIEEGLFFLENRFAKNAIRLERQYGKDLPEIVADPGQIHQILVNLAVNSMQAMPEGGTFTIQTASVPEGIQLRVSDTGVGMPEEIRQKIFLPFFTTKDVQEGTGLGLSVVHGIVSSHHGHIEVESTLGEGTTFTINLPVESAGKEDPHESTEGTDTGGG